MKFKEFNKNNLKYLIILLLIIIFAVCVNLWDKYNKKIKEGLGLNHLYQSECGCH
jgi:hypothetical protein